MANHKNVFDLHMHSNCSDGHLSPTEVIAKCKSVGLQTVALTDHDTVGHVEEAVTAGRQLGVKVIAGAELSVLVDNQELHMLIYGFDHSNEALRRRLLDFKQERITRAKTMVKKLQTMGFVLNFEQIENDAHGTIGKPHVVEAVFAESLNQTLLQNMGIKDKSQFFEHMFGNGKPANVVRQKFPVSEAINLVHAAGGICVLAHPLWTFRKNLAKFPQTLEFLQSVGLDGVETFYRTHTKEETEIVHNEAQRLSLIETAGSDFHWLDDKMFGQLGMWNSYDFETDFSWLENFIS